MSTNKPPKSEPEVHVHDVSKLRGHLKVVGGSMSDDWNNLVANQTVRPASYYTFASGGLGWNAPAAAGIALAQKFSGGGRPVVAVIGDGSFQYSIQCLATAAQHKLKVIYVVPCNGEYAVLKEFALLENTPNVPGLDLPVLDIASTAKGFGCAAVEARSRDEIKAAFSNGLNAEGPGQIDAAGTTRHALSNGYV